MPATSIRVRLFRFVSIFLSLRVIEAVAATVALLITSAVQPLLMQTVAGEWSLERELAGAWLIARIYYLAFHYLLFSAIAFAIAEAVWGLHRAQAATLTNLGAFLLHSAAFVVLVFGGKFEPFWGAWGAVAIVNLLAPALVARRLEKWFATR